MSQVSAICKPRSPGTNENILRYDQGIMRAGDTPLLVSVG